MPPPLKVIKKVSLLGEPFVGKTSLIRRFVLNEYKDQYKPTIGSQVLKKDVLLDFEPERKQQVQLSMLIFDLLGHTEFEKLLRAYIKGSEGALIVSDLTREKTIMEMVTWMELFNDVVGDMPVVLIGNKMDIAKEHRANIDLLQDLAKDRDKTCVLSSAKTGEYVEETFRMLGRRLIKDFPV